MGVGLVHSFQSEKSLGMGTRVVMKLLRGGYEATQFEDRCLRSACTLKDPSDTSRGEAGSE